MASIVARLASVPVGYLKPFFLAGGVQNNLGRNKSALYAVGGFGDTVHDVYVTAILFIPPGPTPVLVRQSKS